MEFPLVFIFGQEPEFWGLSFCPWRPRYQNGVEMRDNIGQDYRMSNSIETDWKNCDLVEVVADKQGGVPLVKGTRIPAQQIVEEAELGSPVDEIAENYPSITRARISAILAYADNHKTQPVL